MHDIILSFIFIVHEFMLELFLVEFKLVSINKCLS